MVKEIVRQVVHDVAKDAATEDCRRHVPIVAKEHVDELVEGNGKGTEKCWWHDKTVPIHR